MSRWVVTTLAVVMAFSRQRSAVADGEPRRLASLADGAVDESSGLAVSGRDPELLWTINDSGDAPLLYATDRAGHALGRAIVRGAINVDWEDLATVPAGDAEPALVIGDIGDFGRELDEIELYRLPEPVIDPDEPPPLDQPIVTAPVERFPLAYPDGAHDAETLLVDPRDGEILIVTKELLGPARIYRVPLPMTPGEPATMELAGLLSLPGLPLGAGLTTGGAVTAVGDRVTVRTYGMAFEWRVEAGQSLLDALMGVSARCSLAGSGRGEAIAYGSDGETLLMTAEGVPCPLFELSLGA